MKKYMTMNRFYDLAKRNNACTTGLEYLKTWMKNNPDKNTVDYFFKDHRQIKEFHIIIYYNLSCVVGYREDSYTAFHIRSFFKWIATKLIDWSEISKIDGVNDESVKWLEEYYNYHYCYCFGTQYDTNKNNCNAIRFLLTSFEGEE